MSHMGLTRIPAPDRAREPAGTRTRKDRPMNTRPQAKLAGLDGSRGPSRIQSQAKAGASRITKMGWTDWNQDEGKDTPSIERRVKRSANRLSVEPACSYAPQKRAANRNRITMAPMRFHSAAVKPADPPAAASADAAARGWADRRSRAGCSRFLPSTYWTRPAAIPTPAQAKPTCQSTRWAR